MFIIDVWFFLFLVFSTCGFYVMVVLYVAHWLMHRRPKKPSRLPPPPSRIVLP